MAAEVRLPTLALPGLSPDSLGNYLASLGLLRVLSRKWPSTRIAWLNGVLRVVGGPSTLDELLDELVRIANDRKWTQYNKDWSDAQKSGTPLALWQAKAPESQLQLFAAHAVPHAHVSFNPLLGSGGNAGRRDFAAGWKKAAECLAAAPKPPKGQAKGAANASSAAPDERKKALQSWLLGQPVTWMVEGLNAGSWFSEATEIYNSGQKPSREAQQVPWAMVLACEGLVFFAGSASRRLGAKSARTVGAFPFITQPIAASAEKEADRLCGEVWTPLWSRPMSLAEVSMLFSRGRAELRGRGALTPASFATAIRKRGVDAGVSEFRRFTLGRTTSSNTFESRLEVRFSLSGDAGRAGEAVATTLDCITALIEQRGFPRDGKRFVGLRGPIESALLGVASEPNRSEAGIALLDAVVRALDRIDRNRSFREAKVRWEPLPLEWLPSLFANEQPGALCHLYRHSRLLYRSQPFALACSGPASRMASMSTTGRPSRNSSNIPRLLRPIGCGGRESLHVFLGPYYRVGSSKKQHVMGQTPSVPKAVRRFRRRPLRFDSGLPVSLTSHCSQLGFQDSRSSIGGSSQRKSACSSQRRATSPVPTASWPCSDSSNLSLTGVR
jgi:hypothetical protein